MTDYWNDQAVTIDGAWHAVFSEPDVMAHTEVDVAFIADMLTSYRHPSNRPPDGPLLDFGCGVGRLTASMAAMTDRKVVGYDPTPNMIEWAINSKLSDQVEFTTGEDVLAWPWAGAYSMLVFQHLPQETVVDSLTAICRSLMPNGRLVFQFVIGDNHSDHDHRYSEDEMTGFCAAAGFADLAVFTDTRHREWCWVAARKQ